MIHSAGTAAAESRNAVRVFSLTGPCSDALTFRRRGASTGAATANFGPKSAEVREPPTASAMAAAIGPACGADSRGGEAALTAVMDAGSVGVSCNVSSQSQASGRLQISSELCSSLDVNLL